MPNNLLIVSADRVPGRSFTRVADLVREVIVMRPTSGFEVWKKADPDDPKDSDWAGFVCDIVVLADTGPQLVEGTRVNQTYLVPKLARVVESEKAHGRPAVIAGKLTKDDGGYELVNPSAMERVALEAAADRIAELLGFESGQIAPQLPGIEPPKQHAGELPVATPSAATAPADDESIPF